MQIRNACETDLPEIVRIYNAAIPGRLATADLEPISVESRLAWYRSHSPNYRPLWVVEHHNQILGWLGFQDFYGRPAYQATAEISIYIDSAFQGQGIGRELLETAIQISPQLGLKNLVAFIFAHNHPSLRLFTRLGFQSWGCMPKVALLDTVERDLLILGLHLMPNETSASQPPQQ